MTGYPGKDCVIARRNNKTWYIAGINGEEKAKKFALDLSFLQGRSGYIISDTNENKRVPLKKVSIDKVSSSTEIEVSANGGFVLVVE